MRNEGGEAMIVAMRRFGFVPSSVYSAEYLEFVKAYADDQGRQARAIARFERPGPWGRKLALSHFVVSMSARVDVESIERAPEVMREDLRGIVDTLSNRAAPLERERCMACRTACVEFFVVGARVLCRGCKED